jgi:hypothetical protein
MARLPALRKIAIIATMNETAERRFYLYVVTATLSTIVAGIAAVDTLLTTGFGGPHGYIKTALNAAAALIVAPFVYNALSKGLLTVMRKSQWVKQRVLKKFYVEGTWAGYYYANESDLKTDDVYYVVDYFEQDLSALTVIGESYTKNGGQRASWESKAAQISPGASRMVFVIDCTIPSKGLRFDAVTEFSLIRTAGSTWPDIVSGRSTNVTTDRLESLSYTVRQKKVCHGIRMDTTAALKHAHQFYKDDKKRLRG